MIRTDGNGCSMKRWLLSDVAIVGDKDKDVLEGQLVKAAKCSDVELAGSRVERCSPGYTADRYG